MSALTEHENDPLQPRCLPGNAPEGDFWPGLWLRVGIVLVLAGQGMAFGLGLNTADPPLTKQNPIYWVLHGGLLLSAVVALVLLSGPLLRETWANVCKLRITVESLFMLSILGAMVGSLLSTLRGQGAVYYEVVAVVLAIYTVGKALGVRGKTRALAEASKLESGLDFAMVEQDGTLHKVPIEELTSGQVVVVAPGEVIPVDGKVLRGTAFVHEQPLTGEPAPVERGCGAAVLAGTHSVDGTLYIQPEHLKGARRFDEVLAAVRETQQNPSRLQGEADRLTRIFVPVVCVVSFCVFLGWLPLAGWGQALFNAMAVLIVACPCALGLATPAAVWVGLATLARFGLVARQGDILEILANARTFVFDKTGTLSLEQLAVTDVHFFNDWGNRRSELAAGLLAIETPLRHPVAEALKEWAKDQVRAELLPQAISVILIPGQGIEAELLSTDNSSRTWRIGKESFTTTQEADKTADNLFINVGGRLVARFTLSETLREDAEQAIEALKGEGIKEFAILSGDPGPVWGALYGIPVEGGLTPLQKVKRLNRLSRPVIFVGDGVNDAPAMAEADAAIALENGAGLSQATADAVLLGGQLSGLPQAVAFSRKLIRAVRGNLRFALVYNLLGMGLAAAGILHPVAAALLMLGSSAFVSGRVMRAAR